MTDSVERIGEMSRGALRTGAERAGEMARQCKNYLDDSCESIKTQLDRTAEATSRSIDRSLDFIAKDPSLANPKMQRLAEFSIQIAPVLGPTRQFAKAREMYAEAQENGDPGLLFKARKEAILSLGNVGFDIGMIVGGFMIKDNKPVTWLSRGIGFTFLSARWFGRPIEPFAPIAERMLKTTDGVKFADALLKFANTNDEADCSPIDSPQS